MTPSGLSLATRLCSAGWQNTSFSAAFTIPLSKVTTPVPLPDSKAGDYLDVVVVTPFGQFLAPLTRFDDREMEILIVDVVERAYQFTQELFVEDLGGKLLLRLTARDPVPQWENPK